MPAEPHSPTYLPPPEQSRFIEGIKRLFAPNGAGDSQVTQILELFGGIARSGFGFANKFRRRDSTATWVSAINAGLLTTILQLNQECKPMSEDLRSYIYLIRGTHCCAI